MKGIYQICFKDKCYIGKDSYIHNNNRLNTHLYLLKRNEHWSDELQLDFNRYGIDKMEYKVLEKIEDCTDEYLCDRERYYIKHTGAYDTGYNQTTGGIGMSGYKHTPQQLLAKSNRIQGEKNPQSKLTNKQFFEMVELFKQGKTNKEIADIYGLHDRYVSLIRHKKRFVSLWNEVKDYEPQISNGKRRGLNYEQFVEVVGLLRDGWTNKAIQEKYGLSTGTGSRIRNKKLYKEFWKTYEREQERSTTIP